MVGAPCELWAMFWPWVGRTSPARFPNLRLFNRFLLQHGCVGKNARRKFAKLTKLNSPPAEEDDHCRLSQRSTKEESQSKHTTSNLRRKRVNLKHDVDFIIDRLDRRHADHAVDYLLCCSCKQLRRTCPCDCRRECDEEDRALSSFLSNF